MSEAAIQLKNGAPLSLFSTPNASENKYKIEGDKNKKKSRNLRIGYDINYRKRRFKIRAKLITGSLFDIVEGSKQYNILLKTKPGALMDYWESLKPNNRVSLVKYVSKINALYSTLEGEKLLHKIIFDVATHNHFPAIIAKLFFEITFNKGQIQGINNKLKLKGWNELSIDEKIVILYDLSCLYPELMKPAQKIYDITREEPGYLDPLVVKEINRIALLGGDFEDTYRKFNWEGWPRLTMDEKVVLTNGLCKSHRGITEDLNQVLYNLRVYNELPAVVIAEKYNTAIDRYLNGGTSSPLVGMIDDYFSQSGELITIKGVEQGKIRAALNRHRASFS